MISNTVYQSAVAQHTEALHNGDTKQSFSLWLESMKQAGQFWEPSSQFFDNYQPS